MFELIQQTGGENETGYQWLLANVTLRTGDALEIRFPKVWTTDGKAGKAGKSSRDGRGGKAGKMSGGLINKRSQALPRAARAAAANGGHAWSGRSTTMTAAAPGTGIRRRPPIVSSVKAIRPLTHFIRHCGKHTLPRRGLEKKKKRNKEKHDRSEK